MRALAPAALCGLLVVGPTRGFAPPPPSLLLCPAATGAGAATRLNSTPEPLATEGDWSAYVDEETTGCVYYFNGVTGESLWEPPTDTFPAIDASRPAATATATADETREDRRAERKRRREEKRKERERSGGGGGGFFGALFGGGGGRKEQPAKKEPAKSKKEQLSELSDMANNADFLSELDDVIAEAEEAIAIAERVEEAPPKNKGGFFSGAGFVGGEEAIEEAESLVSDAEERTSGIFSRFSSGARASPAPAKRVETEPEPEPEPEPEENVWVEGLKNLFQRSFAAFIPPETASTPERKVVAADETPKERKAEVSGTDMLDVVWGAETSARPTLNIAEMMKAFQVQSSDEAPAAKAKGEEEFRTLSLDVSLQVKPHPEKVNWGGEDYGFATGRTFGVFDGVSGAAKERGKKLYSRSLADYMRGKAAGRGALSVDEMRDYMAEAKDLADAEATGASTAVVASVGEDNILRALNLGDSVCLVLRDGAVAARTREIVHYFDCPYQLGDDSPDRPRDGTTLRAELFGGDVVVAGSDGVFDNLSDADVCDIVGSLGPGGGSKAIARRIVERSRAVSLDPDAVTPYSTVARGRSGYESYRTGRGGKVDDISCVVVRAS